MEDPSEAAPGGTSASACAPGIDKEVSSVKSVINSVYDGKPLEIRSINCNGDSETYLVSRSNGNMIKSDDIQKKSKADEHSVSLDKSFDPENDVSIHTIESDDGNLKSLANNIPEMNDNTSKCNKSIPPELTDINDTNSFTASTEVSLEANIIKNLENNALPKIKKKSFDLIDCSVLNSTDAANETQNLDNDDSKSVHNLDLEHSTSEMTQPEDVSSLKKSRISVSVQSLDLTSETLNGAEKDVLKDYFNTDKLYNAVNLISIDKSKSLSLNELEITSLNTTINKSPLSRSAENLNTSVMTAVDTTDKQLNPIDNNLTNGLNNTERIDQEKVLADFDAHKSKALLPQKLCELTAEIPSESSLRAHKENASHDFGSIVKNVHGIFSSVSGSLKYAYNISQKMPTQNKQININKLLTTGSLRNAANGKIMNNIFEIDQSDGNINRAATPDSNIPNSNESSPNRKELNCDEAIHSGTDSNKDFSIADEDKVESLERALWAERLEVTTLKERLRQQAEELLEKERERKLAENKLEALRKRAEATEREKDSAVMRYAVSERAVIGARDAADGARRAERAARGEAELLAGKLRSAHAEKQRICQIYDDKCHELASAERETARLREELKESDGKLKWSQSKLRTEMDAYKEAAAQAERLTLQVAELEAARDAAAASAEDSLRARQYESELKEARASLILVRHDNEELERRLGASTHQLEACRRQLAEASGQLAQLQQQVEDLRASNLRLEEEAAELASLRARAALADTLALQLERETERATSAEEECGRQRARADTCARREAAALGHAARLTAEHVGERALHRRGEAEARALGADNAALREKLSSLEGQLTELRARLADEAARRKKECQLLARKVAELTEELQQSAKKLEWEKGENLVLKKKHASTVKELNRELQRTLKRCEQLEARAGDPPDQSTPTGSVSSLSGSESLNGGAASALPPPAPAAPADVAVNGHAAVDTVSDAQQPDRQTLIERIVQLQRAGARRAERCDFLEEHNRQLTSELRDKARLLRQLLASQPAGALADNTADEHKREMARLGGGAMAAVWGGAAGGMTLELSLEINRKLQAVLEDALLKNITLKNNMDTLGAEIARLKAGKDSA